MADSFVMYKSYVETARKFPKDKQLNFYDWIIDYAIYGKEPDFSSESPEMQFALDVAFGQIKASVSASLSRYEACIENGKKGGAPKGNQNAKKQPKQPKKQPDNQPKEQPKNNLNKNYNYNFNDNSLSATEEGAKAPPPPRRDENVKPFEMGGKRYEEYTATDGERRVRQID